LEQAIARVRDQERGKRRWLVGALAALLTVVALLEGHSWLRARQRADAEAVAQLEAATAIQVLSLFEAQLIKDGPWTEARDALMTAEAGGGGSGELSLRVHKLLDDARTVTTLSHVRLTQGNVRSKAKAFRRAFAEFGIDPLGLQGRAEEAALLIRVSSVRSHLVAALDEWAELEPEGQRRERLLEVARRADPDPWRNQLRDPKVWRDRAALEALSRHPGVAELPPNYVVRLAQLLARSRGDAVPLLESAQECHPADVPLNLALADALARGGRADEAVVYCRVAIALQPRNPAGHHKLGLILAQKKDLGRAIAAHRRALWLAPGTAAFHCDLGKILMQTEDTDEAIKAFRRGVDHDPHLARAHALLGGALAEQGKQEEAVGCYRRT
jgi:serine/threonine-protein kinase